MIELFKCVLRPWQTRTHCCGYIVADTNVSPFACARNICCEHKFCVRDTKNVSDFVQKHFVSATNVSQSVQPKKHHEQQCVLVCQYLYAWSTLLQRFHSENISIIFSPYYAKITAGFEFVLKTRARKPCDYREINVFKIFKMIFVHTKMKRRHFQFSPV